MEQTQTCHGCGALLAKTCGPHCYIKQVQQALASTVKVGDEIRFDHFGGKDRLGRVVKITKSSIHVEWMAPSSGVVRVVKISTKKRPLHWYDGKYHAEASPEHVYSEWDQKNVRLAGPRS